MIKIQSNEENFNEIDFNIIKEKLTKWREERKLTYENQREGFLGNSYEEVSEYFRANNDLERVDALCDIAILSFNAFDVDYTKIKKTPYYDLEFVSIVDITSYLSWVTSSSMDRDFKNFNISRLILACKYLSKKLGYNFDGCILEAIKEIESRTGHYNNKKKKFIKDKGAYTSRQASEYFFISYLYKEDKDYWYFLTFTGRKKIKKWYKADYSKYYIGD